MLLFIQLSFLAFLYHTNAEERLTTHGTAEPLNENAEVSSWPRFNGPNDNATTFETHLSIEKGSLNITKIWELQKGEGYASPAITKNRIVLFHLQNGYEIIEARNPETGKKKFGPINILLNIVIAMDTPMVLVRVLSFGMEKYMPMGLQPG